MYVHVRAYLDWIKKNASSGRCSKGSARVNKYQHLLKLLCSSKGKGKKKKKTKKAKKAKKKKSKKKKKTNNKKKKKGKKIIQGNRAIYYGPRVRLCPS